MKQKLKKIRRPIFIFIAIVLALVTLDIVVAKNGKLASYSNPAVDTYFYETGSDTADYPVQPEISAQAAILRSDNTLLSKPVAPDQELTPGQIEEMVYRVLELDVDQASGRTNLQRLIAEKKAANGSGSCWVALKVNMVFVPGHSHTLSDQTDIRLARAVLRYLAEETEATRISLLACGGYYLENMNDIFEQSLFNDNPIRTWAKAFPGLPEGFTLQQMIEEIQSANQQKTLDMINLNYDELYENGMSYREMTSAERRATNLLYIPVPENNGIGGLPTEDLNEDGGYNPTKAIYRSDVLVNVPKMKTTIDVDINCAMKNYIGSVSRGVYGGYRGGSVGVDHTNLWETVFNLFSLRPSDYVLVDALNCLEGEGSHPWKFYTGYLRRNYLVASSDPIAAESVAAQSMGYHPGDIEMLRWARAKGLGYYEPNRIRILGDSLSSVTLPFKKACNEGQSQDEKTSYYQGRGCTRWLLCGPFVGSNIASNPGGADPAALDPRIGGDLAGKTWTSHYSPGPLVDLKQAFSCGLGNTRVYAFSRIYSPADQQGTLRVGATEGVKVWINGQLVLDEPDNLVYGQREFEVDLSLEAGDNRILVLLNNTSGDFGFSLACIDDGSSTVRESLVPYLWQNNGWTGLSTEPRVFTEQEKKNLFGGQTLPGTFYHLAAGPGDKDSAQPADTKIPCDISGGGYKEDFDRDGITNITDVIALLLYQRDNPGDPECDYNGDSESNVEDAIALLLAIRDGILTPAEPEYPYDTTLVNGIAMVSIPGGTFLMGTEKTDDVWLESARPVHYVTISPFLMSIYEITQAQYEAVMETNPSYFQGDDSHPVERVNWTDAAKYCIWLSEDAGLDPCYDMGTWECDFTKDGFRLPTEAEWEYACRAGTTTEWYTGDDESLLGNAAWYSVNSGNETHPVGQKEPNAFGLYDMHGNVYEWCNDWWGDYTADSLTDPTGPRLNYDSYFRIKRGGCMWYDALKCRSAFRMREYPLHGYGKGSIKSFGCDIGFRVVLRSPPAVLSSALKTGTVKKMESLSRDDIKYIERIMSQLNLTEKEKAAFRLALYGEAETSRLPGAFLLSQNYPNPFNPSTTISYTVPEGSSVKVSLKVYNIRGTLICTLVDKVQEAGGYNVFWDGRNDSGRQVASGIYMYRMQAGDFVQTRKMLLLK